MSDFDIAIASPKLMEKAKGLGIGLRSKGIRTGPLTPKEIKALGLENLVEELSNLANREVKFMIYESVEAAMERTPSILVK